MPAITVVLIAVLAIALTMGIALRGERAPDRGVLLVTAALGVVVLAVVAVALIVTG